MTIRRTITVAASALCAVTLFILYFLQSARGTWITSDGASNALQAWDMLHGNLLLRGWALSDVSFYTTELPEYMLVEAIRGLHPDVVHISAALTYTALIVLAGVLAIERNAAGRKAIVQASIAMGIMLAPQPGNPTGVLLLSPDHVGTGVPVLLIWLIIDRTGQPPRKTITRCLVPVAVGLLFAWTIVADPIAELIGVAPLALTCAVRAVRARIGGKSLDGYELSLAAAALLSVPLAALATRLIAAAGGWTTTSVTTSVIPFGALASHAALTGNGVLQLFGAEVTGQPTAIDLVFAVLHLTGLALAACGLWLAIRGFFRVDQLIVQVLAVAIVLNLVSYLLTYEAQDLASTRDIAAVLPFGAVLAGRLLAGKIARGRYVTFKTVLLPATYVVMLIVNLTGPTVSGPTARLAAWLVAHHFTEGLAGYWRANVVTLQTDGLVQVRAVDLGPGRLVAGSGWESDAAWYDPATQYADFVLDAGGHTGTPAFVRQMDAVAGHPANIYFYDGYVIAEWRENLLMKLR
jgi:hypothetical protein